MIVNSAVLTKWFACSHRVEDFLTRCRYLLAIWKGKKVHLCNTVTDSPTVLTFTFHLYFAIEII